MQQLLVLDNQDANKIEERLSAACGGGERGEDPCHQSAARRATVLRAMLMERAAWVEAEEKRRRDRDREAEEDRAAGATADVHARMALALLCPILESQARENPSVRAVSTHLLRDLLRDLPAQSLPDDLAFERVESVLVNWLTEGAQHEERSLLASCLVCLACARDSKEGLVRAISVLQRRNIPEEAPDLQETYAPVRRLAGQEGGPRQPVHVCHSDAHQGSFAFDNEPMSEWKQDVSGFIHCEITSFRGLSLPTYFVFLKFWYLILAFPPSKFHEYRFGNAVKNFIIQIERSTFRGKTKSTYVLNLVLQHGRPSLACNEEYVYSTDDNGFGIFKIGSGCRGTRQAFCYAKEATVEPGLLAANEEVLLRLPKSVDKDQESSSAGRRKLAEVLDKSTLKVKGQICQVADMELPDSLTADSLALLSDGVSDFFWVRLLRLDEGQREEAGTANVVFVDKFSLTDESEATKQKQEVVFGGRVFLEKCDGETKTESRANVYRKILAGDLGARQERATNEQQGRRGGGGADPSSTSVDINLKVLETSTMWTCGSFVCLLLPHTGSCGGRGAGQARSVGTCESYCLSTGKFHSKAPLLDPGPSGGLHKGAKIACMAAAYEPRGDRVWTASNGVVDVYDNKGLVSLSHVKKILGLAGTEAEFEKESCNKSRISNVLLKHLGISCLFQVLGWEEDVPVLESKVSSTTVDTTLSMLKESILAKDAQKTQTFVSALLYFLSKKKAQISASGMSELKEILSQLATDPLHSAGREVVTELLAQLFLKEGSNQAEVLLTVLDEDWTCVRDKILRLLTLELNNTESKVLALSYVKSKTLMERLFCLLDEEQSSMMEAALDTSASPEQIASLPRETVLVAFTQSVLDALTLQAMKKGETDRADVLQELDNISSRVVGCCHNVLERHIQAAKLIATLKEKEKALPPKSSLMLKRSLLATVLDRPLTTVLLNSELKSAEKIQSTVQQSVQLLVECRRALFAQLALDDDEELEKDESEDATAAKALAFPEDWAPWTSQKIVETPHPIRDGFRFKHTVVVPGAKQLYLRFDKRCATQYDYDKISVHQGKSSNAKKVFEFGGNTYGFGSKSTLGEGWPSEVLQVNGDSVSFSLEMKSGRESATPDRAVWGIKIQVSCTEPGEETAEHSFLQDLTQALTSNLCKQLEVLYEGQKVLKEEQECGEMLESALLQRCIWHQWDLGQDGNGEDDEMQAHGIEKITLPEAFLQVLRGFAESRMPPMRNSVKTTLDPENLEKMVLSAVAKHLGLREMIELHMKSTSSETEIGAYLSNVVPEAFHKLHSLVRRLQVMAELENQWENEVENVRDNLVPADEIFFLDYQFHESKSKELAILLFLKGVATENKSISCATMELRNYLEKEALLARNDQEPLALTKKVVKGILKRAELLLRVNMPSKFTDQDGRPSLAMSKSLQMSVEHRRQLSRQESAELQKSLDDSILQVPKLKRGRKAGGNRRKKVMQELERRASVGEVFESQILQDLFSFVGSYPEKAVSANSFLKAAMARRKRSRQRIQSLALMKGVLLTCDAYGDNPNLVRAIIALLSGGPRSDQLKCGGLVQKVTEAFSETIGALVEVLSQNPVTYKVSICQICMIPYSKEEENCLTRSKVIGLLDRLCGLHHEPSEDVDVPQQPEEHKLAKMAWAAFKVLAHRCVQWDGQDEESEMLAQNKMEIANSKTGLSRQVSSLLSNHLIQASQAHNGTALQEVLQLLTELSHSRLGKEIISHPRCISKLLCMMVEPSLSPRMVLTVAKLCHVALPLMSSEKCNQIQLWHPVAESDSREHTLAKQVVSLLMKKLADFLVPGYQELRKRPEIFTEKVTTERQDSGGSTSNRMSLFLHSNGAISAQDLIQQLIEVNRELRIFSSSPGSENMERISRMDKELTKHRKAEVFTDEATIAFRKAVKLAEQGFVVSVGAPKSDAAATEMSEQKRELALSECKKKNVFLARHDPQRPFLSHRVAGDLAAEIVSLLQSLLETTATDIWTEAICSKLNQVILALPAYIKDSQKIFETSGEELGELYHRGKELTATLSLLGCFKEHLKVGTECTISDAGPSDRNVTIRTIVKANRTAQVSEADFLDTESVAFSRLEAASALDKKSLILLNPLATVAIGAIQDLLIPDAHGIDSLSSPLPASGDAKTLRLMNARLVSEIRKKACQLLARLLETEEGATFFLQRSCHAVDMLKCLSKDCLPADREPIVEMTNDNLRALYRNGIKPPPPPIMRKLTDDNFNSWDTATRFPPLRGIVFNESHSALTYQAEPSMEEGLPRGAFVYARHPFNPRLKESYFEAKILSLGNSDDSGASSLSIGLSPAAEQRDGGGNWTNPEGSVLLHNNGRIVHYCGGSLLQWKSTRVEHEFHVGDVIGIGWKRASGGETALGSVFVTVNGRQLEHEVEGIAGGLFPVVHAQRKLAQVKANFGQEKYAFHAANAFVVVDEEECKSVAAAFKNLPFSAQEKLSPVHKEKGVESVGHRRMNFYTSRGALKAKPQSSYDYQNILNYRLPSSVRCPSGSGSAPILSAPLDDESDDDESDEEDSEAEGASRKESLNSLLVKAWENKVFPVIKRRFRNDTERNDGLEQIRGALSLGMADIARQTVEFLYEENGGIPRDLRLPTIEDVKKDMAKFTIDKIRKGDAVTISPLSKGDETAPSSGEFATVSQMKTFGLSGEVLEIDEAHQLVEVETYLAAEGILVRYWYPLTCLQRPDQGRQKGELVAEAQVVNLSSHEIHRELINNDFVLSRLFCRQAYLNLLRFARFHPLLPRSTSKLQRTTSAEMTMFTSSILLLQDIDMENLLHLCTSCLKTAETTGNLMSNELDGISPADAWEGADVRKLFYAGEKLDDLRQELRRVIYRAAQCGEESLIELSSQICQCLLHAGDYFTLEEVVVSDVSSLKSTVSFRGSCCTLICPKINKDVAGGPPSDLEVDVLTLQGDTIRKNGLNSAKTVVRFPMKLEPFSCHFAPCLLPADLVRVSHSGGGNDSVVLEMHGLPPELPLALAFALELVEEKGKNPEAGISDNVLYDLAVALVSFVANFNLPPALREHVFQVSSSVLESLDQSKVGKRQLPSKSLFKSLQREMGLLHVKEATISKYTCSLFEFMVAARRLWPSEFQDLENEEGMAWFVEASRSIGNLRGDQKLPEQPAPRSKASEGDIGLILISGFSTSSDLAQTKDRIIEILSRLGGTFKDRLAVTKIPSEAKESSSAETVALLKARWCSKKDDYVKRLRATLEVPGSSVKVHPVSEDLLVGDDRLDRAARSMLSEVLFGEEELSAAATDVFQSCYFSNLDDFSGPDQEMTIRLRKRHILALSQPDGEGNAPGNLMQKFFSGMARTSGKTEEALVEGLLRFQRATTSPESVEATSTSKVGQ